jgi:hypothetical protein
MGHCALRDLRLQALRLSIGENAIPTAVWQRSGAFTATLTPPTIASRRFPQNPLDDRSYACL